jgi:hypothetical protein
MKSALRAVFVAMAMTSAALWYAQADVGGSAPDFLGSTTDGKDFKISTYRGKVVAISKAYGMKAVPHPMVIGKDGL